MNTHRLFASAAVLAALVHSMGCTAQQIDSESDDDSDGELDSESAGEAEDTGEVSEPLVNGTTTTDFAPVVRISWSESYSCGFLNLSTCTTTHYCTATAIADDLLVTASHCVKDGTSETDNIGVAVAHGANSGSVGKSSSYFIMSDDIYNNVSSDSTGDYWYRDFTFVKFGAGTFSSYYGTTYASGDPSGTSVTKVGFGGDSTKEYATKTISWSQSYDSGDYRLAFTSRSGAYGEGGDSGGPLLKWNSSSGTYEVLGVVFGSATYSDGSSYDVHPIFTSAMETHILAPLRTDLPKYCVEAFENVSYGGFPWSICNETSLGYSLDGFSDPFIAADHWNYGGWNDEMSSLQLPTANTVLTLYEGAGQSGSSVTFQNMFSFGSGSVVPDLGNEGSFNDKVSSFSMTSGGSGTTTDWLLEITRYGKCVDVDNGGPNNGAKVQQWSCAANNTNMVYRLQPVGNSYQIYHPASGKCLDVYFAGTADGTKVQLYTCNGTGAQLWTMSSNTSTASVRDFKIVNPNSGKCLDLSEGSSANGAQMWIWTCDNSNTNQNFALKKL